MLVNTVDLLLKPLGHQNLSLSFNFEVNDIFRQYKRSQTSETSNHLIKIVDKHRKFTRQSDTELFLPKMTLTQLYVYIVLILCLF